VSDDDKNKSNCAIAVDKIRALIFSGELGPGTSHLESELADTLGMSRTPIREAALMLEAQGLLEVRPRKGVRIVPVSPTDMREIYDVLTELESLAAADAAKRNYGRAELKAIEETIDNMDASLAAEDRRAWAEADEAFHTELVRLGGNSRVQSIVAMMSDQVRRARMVTLFIRPLPTDSNVDHRALLEAIRRQDADLAKEIHRNHRLKAKETLLNLLETHQLKSL